MGMNRPMANANMAASVPSTMMATQAAPMGTQANMATMPAK